MCIYNYIGDACRTYVLMHFKKMLSVLWLVVFLWVIIMLILFRLRMLMLDACWIINKCYLFCIRLMTCVVSIYGFEEKDKLKESIPAVWLRKFQNSSGENGRSKYCNEINVCRSSQAALILPKAQSFFAREHLF